MNGKILAVDDTPDSLKLLTQLLQSEGYEIRSAINGELALQSALLNPPELILLDVRMPDMDGFEVCRRLKAYPQTRSVPVIFVTALSEINEKVDGFKLGAVDFITKPYQREELLVRVRTHLEMARLRNGLESLVNERTAELKANMLSFVTAIASTVEMRDPYTAGHQRRTAHLASAIAQQMRLGPDLIEGLSLAGVVHDIGKIKVPAEILCKPGKLDELEYGLIKLHPQTGYEILKSIDFPWPIAQTVLQHHERLDGSGYPQGKVGADILPEAKILAIADVVEAMISHRPYRPGLGIAAALREIAEHRNTLYDAAAVDACLALFQEKHYQLPA
ncbi:response regulator [Methylomonas sp. EFPC3]|uniref:HD domain-containing phosphohydrolase n=1 Tax=Methylomonas sp. EFPC3 TaxID=3021710 RepID=UPI002415A7F6|nr:HD domain-containing phosphohydrolase [Methylomonas sp. EFPC3]WFP51557.1 response regulator [Methylomonas sp. EFPC3]